MFVCLFLLRFSADFVRKLLQLPDFYDRFYNFESTVDSNGFHGCIEIIPEDCIYLT